MIGYWPLFSIARYKIQKEVNTLLKVKVPDIRLEVISIPITRIALLDWKEENKEFCYGGEMYDVVRSEVKGGFIFYHCLSDKQEDALLEHMEELESGQFDNDRSPVGRAAKSIVKLFATLNSITVNSYSLVPASSSYLQKFNYADRFISSVFREIFSPPPNFS